MACRLEILPGKNARLRHRPRPASDSSRLAVVFTESRALWIKLAQIAAVTRREESPKSREPNAGRHVGGIRHQTGQAVKLSQSVRSLALAAVAGGAIVGASSQSQAAGLFEFLFGGAPRSAPQYYAPPSYGSAPLDVRVSPRKRSKTTRAPTKVRPGKERTTKVVNRSIDPRLHPNWYLEDPTLRRGDVIVLPTGVMVYKGGPRPQTREDFVKLSETSLVSKKERIRIEQMAGPPAVSAERDDPARGKEAAGAVNPVQ